MRTLIGFLALAITVACGGDGITDPASVSLAGTYSLKTVNGSPLPFTVSDATGSATLTSDVMTVADAGTWTEHYTFRLTVNGTTTNESGDTSGTWSRSGTSVTFKADGGTAYTGTFNGSGFTLNDGDHVYVFAK